MGMLWKYREVTAYLRGLGVRSIAWRIGVQKPGSARRLSRVSKVLSVRVHTSLDSCTILLVAIILIDRHLCFHPHISLQVAPKANVTFVHRSMDVIPLGTSLRHEATPTLEAWPPQGMKRDWSDFVPPKQISENHPYLSRYCQSKLIHQSADDVEDETIPELSLHQLSTVDQEVYGYPSHPIRFRIGNGGAGYTRILMVLAKMYIATHGNDFRIGWVANHSRHTQLALLGDIVQVALTYEPENEDLAIEEGWARRTCKVFNDHFLLVGNKRNSAKVTLGAPVHDSLRKIGRRATSDHDDTIFHTRGDGSATNARERELMREARVNLIHDHWIHTYSLSPYEALKNAAKESLGVYMLTDRSTYLTIKRHNVIPHMRVYAEGGDELLNPCSALINTKVPSTLAQQTAVDFANWLASDEVQAEIEMYGRGWDHDKTLFTTADQADHAKHDSLVGLDW